MFITKCLKSTLESEELIILVELNKKITVGTEFCPWLDRFQSLSNSHLSQAGSTSLGPPLTVRSFVHIESFAQFFAQTSATNFDKLNVR